MNATNDTPRRKTTWGELRVGDVWISNPPVNNTLTVTEIKPGPWPNVFIAFNDGSQQINPESMQVTIVA